MIKKILLFIILFLPNFVYADLNQPEITQIRYNGNLEEQTEILVRGNNFDKCESVKVGDQKIKYKSKNQSEIILKYSDFKKQDGTIFVECGKKTINKVFSFPYIEKIDGDEKKPFDGYLNIFGKNFGNNIKVYLEGGSFYPKTINDHIIVGKIKGDIFGKKVFIEKDGLKSNIISLNLKIPKINFIYSPDNFNLDGKIYIYGENLNENKDTKIKIGEKFLKYYDFDPKKGFIKFDAGYEIGEKEIKIFSNGLYSNGLKINIEGKSPKLEGIYEKTEELNLYGNNELKKRLYITGENFYSEKEKVKIYKNGNQIPIKALYGNKIIIEDYKLDDGKNLFQVEVNKKFSNIICLEKKSMFPYVGNLKIGGVDKQKNTREIRIVVNNFISSSDEIYFNGGKIEPKGCFGNQCIVNISAGITKGNFGVGRNGKKSILKKEFDIAYENTPFIDYVFFNGEIKKGSKVVIYGGNFDNANINIENLFEKNKDGKTLFKVSNGTIEGRIAFKYDINKKTNININKYGLNANLNFSGKDISGKRVNGLPLIKEVNSLGKDFLFKPGTKVEILGKGFKYGSKVLIGGMKTPLILKKNSYGVGYFLIPENIKTGNTYFQIENNEGFLTNSKNIFISGKNDLAKIFVSSQKIEKKFFNINKDIYEAKLYDLKFDNKLSDIVIKKVVFQVENYKEETGLGTFVLKWNNKKIGETLIEKDGKIIFENISFDVLNSINSQNLTLHKKSRFIKNSNFKIKYLENETKAFGVKNNKNFSNILNENIFGIDFVVGTEKNVCIDSKNDKGNCNNFISNNFNYEEKKEVKQEKIVKNKTQDNSFEIVKRTQIKETKEIEVKKPEIKNKNIQKQKLEIEKKLNILYEKLSKKPLKTQISFLNKLRYQLKKISSKIEAGTKKQIIDFMYENVSLQYKKIKIKYIKSFY